MSGSPGDLARWRPRTAGPACVPADLPLGATGPGRPPAFQAHSPAAAGLMPGMIPTLHLRSDKEWPSSPRRAEQGPNRRTARVGTFQGWAERYTRFIRQFNQNRHHRTRRLRCRFNVRPSRAGPLILPHESHRCHYPAPFSLTELNTISTFTDKEGGSARSRAPLRVPRAAPPSNGTKPAELECQARRRRRVRDCERVVLLIQDKSATPPGPRFSRREVVLRVAE